MYALVSETLARSIGHGENVVGKNIRLDSYPNNTIIIGGIFEEMPENSHIQYDAIVSLASISKFFWDGTDNWIGNERYGSFVKLHPSASPESITPAIEKAKGKYLDTESLQKAGYQVSYTLQPLTGLHSSDPATGRMSVMPSSAGFRAVVHSRDELHPDRHLVDGRAQQAGGHPKVLRSLGPQYLGDRS